MGSNSEKLHWLWAICGAMVIGVAVPSILVQLLVQRNFFEPGPVVLLTWSPGAISIGIILYFFFKEAVTNSKSGETFVASEAMIIGAFMFVLNAPAYFLALLMRPLSVCLLLAVSGCFSGAWIAWQAWRSVHPEEKFWPRFSLGTLLIVVIAWGALLAVFAPK